MTILEYKYKKEVTAYVGMSRCIKCDKAFELNTTDKELFNKTKCFKCFMENNHA